MAARRFGRPGWPWLFAAAASGALAASGLAPLGCWGLALPAFALLVGLVDRAEAPGWIGWAGGAGYFAAGLNWIIEPFFVDAARDGWMAPFAILLLSAGLALFWALPGWLAGRLRLGGTGFALLLSLAELARGYVLTGFPWATPGQIWIGHAPAQAAALFGQYGLTLSTLLAAAGLARLRPWPVAGSVALLAAGFAYGGWRLSLPEPAPRDVTLRLVQPNAEQHLKWDAARAELYLRRQLDYTATGPAVDLTIWPETAIPYTFEDAPELMPMIASAARGGQVALGVQRLQPDGDDLRFFNSLVVLGPAGERLAGYDKHHLVPFGEYVPLGDLLYDWFGLRAFAARAGASYSAGPAGAALDLGPRLGRVLPLICYEAVFPQDLRLDGPRADWILQITNDAWFGTLSGPFQHAAQARLRAIEQGLPLVRVANTGVSAVYDARGRVAAELPFGVEGWRDVALPAAWPVTPYARLGDLPVAGLAACLLFWQVWALRRRRRWRFGA